MANNEESSEVPKQDRIEFKMPVLVGRIGKLPKKVKIETENSNSKQIESTSQPKDNEISAESKTKSPLPPADLLKEFSTPIPYKEPKWSGICPDGSEYALEVLKSGMIMEKVELINKPFYVFGRLANCDVVLAHPTISRYHAVLQYKAFAEEGEQPSGWYIFDLGSTHGTFVNRERIKDNHYVRVRVGYQIKFGSSTRTYIVLGPDFDAEGESELSVTEIKRRAQNLKLEKERMIKEAIEQRERDRVEEEKRREEQGIDWGMGEDAEEEPDLAENPYAAATNEELYLDDPKKTLRGYFEREGHELSYNCEERGIGQYLCRVELPIDDSMGKPLTAEVIHRGKKKEAVVACALEACRMLDRAGLLRQAKHESRKRKERDWGADDYYDSDEDTFLDRTGSVEKKRRARMEKHGVVQAEAEKPLTYDDLLEQITEIDNKIKVEEKGLENLRSTNKQVDQSKGEEDALDEYMNSLGKQGLSMAMKAEISKSKMNIQKLKSDLSKTKRLAEIARPAHLPAIIKKYDNKMAVKHNKSIVYGKRIKLKEDLEKRPKVKKEVKQEDNQFVEEMDSDEESPRTEDITDRQEMKVEKEANGEFKIEDSKEKVLHSVEVKEKKMYGPMRPSDNYVIPEDYFDQESDRDLPEIDEKDI